MDTTSIFLNYVQINLSIYDYNFSHPGMYNTQVIIFSSIFKSNRDGSGIYCGNGPKVGKCFINLAGCSFAAERLILAVKNSDVIICDEVGPMELNSRELMDSVKKLLDVGKKLIVVVHQKIHNPLIEQFKKKSSLIIDLNLGNRTNFTKY